MKYLTKFPQYETLYVFYGPHGKTLTLKLKDECIHVYPSLVGNNALVYVILTHVYIQFF